MRSRQEKVAYDGMAVAKKNGEMKAITASLGNKRFPFMLNVEPGLEDHDGDHQKVPLGRTFGNWKLRESGGMADSSQISKNNALFPPASLTSQMRVRSRFISYFKDNGVSH